MKFNLRNSVVSGVAMTLSSIAVAEPANNRLSIIFADGSADYVISGASYDIDIDGFSFSYRGYLSELGIGTPVIAVSRASIDASGNGVSSPNVKATTGMLGLALSRVDFIQGEGQELTPYLALSEGGEWDAGASFAFGVGSGTTFEIGYSTEIKGDLDTYTNAYLAGYQAISDSIVLGLGYSYEDLKYKDGDTADGSVWQFGVAYLF